MRRAFTLIELLTVVAIAGMMVTVAMVSITRGQTGARMKGATRDIFATIRRARSVALVSQQPAVITYSSVMVDGEICARVEINSSKMMKSDAVFTAQTLSGETVTIGADASEETPLVEDGGETDGDNAGDGETIEDILFSSISDDVVRGIAIKVTVGDEMLEFDRDEAKSKSKISVFSNVDYLLGRFNESRAKAEEKKDEPSDASAPDAAASSANDLQEPVSVVWEVNGRCEPHRVWVYPAGSTPDKGLSIKIDRFGAAKVLAQGEDD